MRRISTKEEKRQDEYRKSKEGFLRFWTYCEFPGCFKKVTDVHHKAGRTGKNLLDTKTWMAVCREHHIWIEDHKNEARKKGWITYK